MKPLLPSADVGELLRASLAFRQEIDALKTSLSKPGPSGFDWYPYNSLSNLEHLDRLLQGSRRRLLELAGGKPVADLGCADGDLAFFLERHGCTVHAVDCAATNHNGMQGVRTLHEALGSQAVILECDMDSQFDLPEPEYGLVFLLGTLYHLKNPCYMLEFLARRARHLVLSTRITETAPGVPSALGGVPVAYLLGEDELNADDSNFWIFTRASLARLLKRMKWGVLDSLTVGAPGSDPNTLTGDQRFFCLAESRFALANMELLHGWHEAEGSGWRWTEARFAAATRGIAPGRPVSVRLKLFVPPLLAERSGPVTMRLAANGTACAPSTFSGSGGFTFERRLPAAVVPGQELRLEFSLDRAIPPDSQDGRERGVIVAALEVESR